MSGVVGEGGEVGEKVDIGETAARAREAEARDGDSGMAMVALVLVHCPCRPGRQLWHLLPAFTHEQFRHQPVLLHLQHVMESGSKIIALAINLNNNSFCSLKFNPAFPF